MQHRQSRCIATKTACARPKQYAEDDDAPVEELEDDPLGTAQQVGTNEAHQGRATAVGVIAAARATHTHSPRHENSRWQRESGRGSRTRSIATSMPKADEPSRSECART